LDISSQKFHA